MALHRVGILLGKGFSKEELEGFVEAGLMIDASEAGSWGRSNRTYGPGEMLVTVKSPSSWPKEHRAIWNAHKTYHTKLNPL